MSYEVIHNGNGIFKGWEDPLAVEGKLKSALAELELVKAELEEANKNVQLGLQFYKSLVEKNAELTSLKSRLPKNADGDGIAIGDNHYVADESTVTGSAQWYVKGILMSEKDNSKFMVQVKSYRNGEVRTVNPEDCHSTAESCRAAAEGGETNG